MIEEKQATLVLHGLETDNRLVRADVFARKLTAFLRGLVAADKLANGKQLHQFVITDLAIGSAKVKIREKQKTRERPTASGVATYERALGAIYNGDRHAQELPEGLLATVTSLTKGVDSDFAHGEVSFASSNVVRVDDYLHRQSQRTRELMRHPVQQLSHRYYHGLARGAFDGVLRVMDSRGETLRAKLVTTAGGVEIDCVVNKSRVPEIRELLEERVRIEGLAHYDGEQQIPVRVDINKVHIVKQKPDLIRWRGAMLPGATTGEDW
ncbi:hypothetical protein IAI58_17835 (plasmid) [Roseomonas marmotae]|uniref:hypothetical protein n=1 Tax=Roseomonas marmotae TaxID=2768161 RepID=UPI001AD6FEAE|nr:hypothetical protein [Roseomonas marmotae]QTI81203.1 hypothetical protein IAI58_17835 [Roseomonas marmotae]